MIRAAVLLLLPALVAQPVPIAVRYGAQPGTLQFSLPGDSVPLVAEGADWVCTLQIVYRVIHRNGETLEQAEESIPIRLSLAQKQVAVSQPLTLTRPLPRHPEAAEFRVEITGRPSGAKFAGALPLGAASFTAEAGLALVPFQVERSGGGFVTGLKDEDIVVTDGASEHSAKVYPIGGGQADAMPLDITLLFDRSGSMRAGAGSNPEMFRKGILEEFPAARVAVYGFSNQLVRLTGPTRDEAELRRAMTQLNKVPPAATPLYWAVAETIRRFDRTRPAVRILAVLSDGLDSGSDVTFEQAMREAQSAGVSIFPVVVPRAWTPQPPPGAGRRAAKGSRVTAMMNGAAPAMQFRHLADTGGVDLTALEGTDLLSVLFSQIGRKMRTAYVAAFTPAPGTRKVRVVLRDPSRGTVVGGVRIVTR